MNGAGDGIRTRDIDLGKVALYQLSYSRETGSPILLWFRCWCQTWWLDTSVFVAEYEPGTATENNHFQVILFYASRYKTILYLPLARRRACVKVSAAVLKPMPQHPRIATRIFSRDAAVYSVQD